ncbi:MAG: ribosome maturation factor RimM [Acidobacteriia bacterium]|nr:ribosome maturation factor RimM [Terriglobia bacterium]
MARVRKTQGRKGEVVAEIWTDYPERFLNLKEVRLVQPDGSVRHGELENAWFHKNGVVLKFCGIDSISAAELLVGCEVRIPYTDLHLLPKDHHYIFEVVGCRVTEDSTGRPIGRVKECVEFGGQWTLNVETEHGEVFIPFAAEICCSVEIQQREIRVRLPEGLLEVNR